MLNFLRWRWVYFMISLLVILPGVYSLVRFGLRPSIDFTGGTELEVQVLPRENQVVNPTAIANAVGTAAKLDRVERKKEAIYILRADTMTQAERIAVMRQLAFTFESAQERRFETIGPILGRELLAKTLAALALSATGISIYVAYRFREWRYGVCAVLAMLHDSLVLLGVFSLLGHFQAVEVDVLFVTAVLTVLSFSVHDTIVVYDRIRELRRKHPAAGYGDLLNMAVTETMSRSINNSMTIIFMLLSLWLLGGETIRWFVFALLIGTITGTYSSTFVAVPLLSVWQDISLKRRGR